MNDLPGVSIVIPNYNYERFVGAAIESALAQDHPDVEVIVVDDGSTDDSRSVLAGFDDRVRAVSLANGGHVAACNAGWPLARHEIVIFLDADDLLMPEAASSVARVWRSGISKVQWRLQVVDQAGRLAGSSFPKYPRVLEPAEVRNALLKTGGYPCPPTSGNAFARWFLEALAPIEGHRWMDPILITAAPLYGDIVTIDQPLSAYRCHDTNDSKQSLITEERFQRYLENERVRLAYLAERCRILGISFDPARALSRNVWFGEAQLMEVKLRGGWSGSAALSAIFAVMASPQSMWQRSLRAFWLGLIAVMPLSLARRLIEMRFVPVRRPRVIEGIVRPLRDWRRQGSGRVRMSAAADDAGAGSGAS